MQRDFSQYAYILRVMSQRDDEVVSEALTMLHPRLPFAKRSASLFLVLCIFTLSGILPGMVHAQENVSAGVSEMAAASQHKPADTCATPSDSSAVLLSLHEAVRLALKQNPQLLAARVEALESRQTTRIARSAFLPKASLSLEEQANRLNLATLIGQESPPYSIGPYGNVQLRSNFDIPIIAVSAWRGYQAQKQRERASQFDAATTQETIASIVVNQYLSLLRAKATERAVQSRIDLAQALLHLADDQLTQGTGTHTDALRANVELQVEKQNLVAAQTDTRGFGYGLAQVLGLNANQYVIATEDLNAHDEDVPDERQSLAEALTTRPDLSALEALSSAARYDQKASSTQRLPEFDFDGYWAQSGRSPGAALPVYTYQAEIRIPIFTGGRISAESHRAELATTRSNETISDRRNLVTQEVRTALSSLRAARQELQLSTEALRLSTREVIESRDRFEAGITNNIEVITAQTSLAQAADSQIGAMYRLQQAEADLSRARGRIAEEYGN
jgi:outer membrane protein